MQRTSKARGKKGKAASDLLEAILAGSLDEIKRIVSDGVDLNARADDGFTPLMLAATRGDPSVTEFLIGKGADVNARNKIGQTPLMIAAQGGFKDVAQQLIAAGADVRTRDNEGRNAVVWAATRQDFPEVVSLLAVSGADYNNRDVRGMTPLMYAALMGFPNSTAILLTVGADEKVKFGERTAYQMAADKGHHEVCKTMKSVLESRPKGHRI